MRMLGLTSWRIFLILWAAFCALVASAWLGYHWAAIACRVIEVAVTVVGAGALVAVLVLLGWERRQERKGGDVR